MAFIFLVKLQIARESEHHFTLINYHALQYRIIVNTVLCVILLGSLGGIVHTIPNSDQGSQISTTNGVNGTKKQGYQNNAMNGYNPDQEGNISYNPDQDGIINGYYSGTLPQHISPVQSSSCVYTADADTPL